MTPPARRSAKPGCLAASLARKARRRLPRSQARPASKPRPAAAHRTARRRQRLHFPPLWLSRPLFPNLALPGSPWIPALPGCPQAPSAPWKRPLTSRGKLPPRPVFVPPSPRRCRAPHRPPEQPEASQPQHTAGPQPSAPSPQAAHLLAAHITQRLTTCTPTFIHNFGRPLRILRVLT